MLNLRSRAWGATLSLSLMLTSATAWSTPPELAPPPAELFGSFKYAQQMDDPELVREMSEEETLVDLQDIEYGREALSNGRGMLLSAIPGAGWSLVYANRKAQGLLVIAGSIAGYALGAAYLTGAFDEKAQRTCSLSAYNLNTQATESRTVGIDFCSNPNDFPLHPTNPNATRAYTDPNLLRNGGAPDPTKVIFTQAEVPAGYTPPLFTEVRSRYQAQTRGADYDGTSDGLAIIATTYAVTTVVAAVWSWVEINDQNDELRKRIESTAQGPQPPSADPVVLGGVRPTFSHTAEQTVMGLGGSF